MTTLYLIRHAEAEGNVYHFFQGCYDSLLTPRGARQAGMLARTLAYVPFEAVYASDLYRARATAVAVAAPHRLPLRYESKLREMNFGVWEGRPWGEIARFYPGGLSVSEDYRPPAGGETFRETALRVRGAVAGIVERHPGGTVAVVSHGTALRTFLALALGNAEIAARPLGNASYTVLEAEPDGAFRLRMLNVPPEGERENTGAAEPPVPDLWYQRPELARDGEELRRAGIDSWRAVYGTLNGFDADSFMENTEGMLAASQESAFFCMLGEERAGLLLLDTRQQDERDAGHIALVYLRPEFRHRGLGAQLIGKAVVTYRAMGRRTLRLNVARRNRTAMRLYQSQGFLIVKSFFPRVSSQLVMKKDIQVPPFPGRPAF